MAKSKTEVNELTDKIILNGGLLTKMHFDMQSNKAEDLQPLMTDLINNRLLKAPGVVYCTGVIEEPIKLGDIFSTTAAMTILLTDVGAAINIAFNFAPAAIEILRPDKEVRISISHMHTILLGVSDISVKYSEYILSRVLTKDDYDKVIGEMAKREELGKKMLDNKKDPSAKKV